MNNPNNNDHGDDILALLDKRPSSRSGRRLKVKKVTFSNDVEFNEKGEQIMNVNNKSSRGGNDNNDHQKSDVQQEQEVDLTSLQSFSRSSKGMKKYQVGSIDDLFGGDTPVGDSDHDRHVEAENRSFLSSESESE